MGTCLRLPQREANTVDMSQSGGCEGILRAQGSSRPISSRVGRSYAFHLGHEVDCLRRWFKRPSSRKVTRSRSPSPARVASRSAVIGDANRCLRGVASTGAAYQPGSNLIETRRTSAVGIMAQTPEANRPDWRYISPMVRGTKRAALLVILFLLALCLSYWLN